MRFAPKFGDNDVTADPIATFPHVTTSRRDAFCPNLNNSYIDSPVGRNSQ
jgi:hypothetical protein